MNKKLSPLEALNDLIEGLEDEHLGLSESEWVVERKQIIEIALKRLEQLEEEKQSFDRQLEKKLKALELLKRNLVIAFEEDNGIDLPTLVVGIKVSKDKLCVIYATQDKEEIRVLKEVLL